MSREFRQGPIGRRCALVLLASCCLTLTSACGSKAKGPVIKGEQLPVFPVSGQLQMGSEPMADAQLVFYPTETRDKNVSKIRPHAYTDESGGFKVSTYGSEDGAPAGKYIVTVSWRGAKGEGVTGDSDDRPEKVPAPFLTPRASRLRVEIHEGENTLTPWDLATLGQPTGQQQTSIAN